ncbi:hypothetical protein [Lentibacillus sp. Marseille-P4043]|uniref:hypothetical protein n=1 Tax=Lentibacillus sp. Marseille-P4043 TaxID=2040293 RepID=UPI000D0B9A49|nr:hypothetical protein [Lentibacillus sp. Marseille-P4043]
MSFQTVDNTIIQYIQGLPEVSDCFEKNDRIYAVTDDTDTVLAAIFQQKIEVTDIQVEQGRLDDVFEHLTDEQEEVI